MRRPLNSDRWHQGHRRGGRQAISTNKQRSDEAVSALTAAKATIEAEGKAVAEARKRIEEAESSGSVSANQLAAKLEEAQALRDESEEASKRIVELKDAAEKAEARAEKSSASADELVAAVTEHQATAADLGKKIAETAESARADREKLSEVLAHITKEDEVASGYEKRIFEVDAQLKDLLQRIEKLLPGAASASLASSFNQQRARFKASQSKWIWTFVLCIVALLAVSAPSFWRATFGASVAFEWKEILHGLAVRLPVAIPLVWLAIYAGRNYMLSLRLEEDYAYKEAISTAFEGYKREMTDIPAGDGDYPTPLTTLCSNVLKAVAERPGRIYDGKHEDITILTEVQTAAKEAQQLSNKNIAKV